MVQRRRRVSVTWPGERQARSDHLASSATDIWARHLSLLLSVEIRAAVTDQKLTAAEAEQLLARLVLVIDQAITSTQG